MGPHEILVFTVEDVLMDIYDGNLEGVETDAATKAFAQWLEEHKAHYYSNSRLTLSEATIHGVLEAIKKGRKIVVVSTSSSQGSNPGD